ncbi:PSD1 and planctomycete cytochrome C domain-containing protein [Tautonia plasticadhaerens]|uniref:Planctomycete cytochrome C n=1 Tax=Tautonia plasticadhaerens TaxID=2527974 RepID=A0A518H7N4_9BACT|nr:PSD1 and planctomycete cytochrome C domain-containing protein [Tautonia plasticadhaerens]QDV36835.1 Planctomycete cytochrome C [Tautonia plasticadhaerens]
MIAIATNPPRIGLIAVALGLLPVPAGAQEAAAVDRSPEAIAFFEARVRPVLAENCLSCHGASKQNSGLRLDSRGAILDGGFIEGPGVYLDDPDASPLLLAVRHEIDLKMPPDGKLDDREIADLTRWVGMGMPWPDDATIPTPEDAADAGEAHWAFQPVGDPEPPAVSDPSWVESPIDAFILDRLDEEGIAPSPPADRRTLLRRASFDLIGLPPTPGEIDAFLDDPRPDDEAFAEVVDRLLASPHYGERWGRHWLDVARYADTKGYVFTEERRYPYAYTYRDYVVRAFNEDKPFDRFVVEQLAADALDLPEGDPALAAMGFLTVGQRFLNSKHDIIDDRIDVVGRGLMGLTISCARCHDHKYDPIPTADYYSFYGVFDSSTEPESLPLIAEAGEAGGPDREDFQKQLAERQAVVADFERSKWEAFNADFQDRLPRYLDAALALDFGEGLNLEGRGRDQKVDTEARARELSTRRLTAFLAKWSGLLERTRGGHDPIFSPWHALAELPAERFAEEAPGVLDALEADQGRPINPVITRALREPGPPATFAEVVARYGGALAESGDAEDPGRDRIAALFDRDGGPLAIARDEVTRYLERDERDEHRGLERKIDELQVRHPGAPPRAMVMVDSERPSEPVIFLRGNAGNRGPEVPRRFLRLIEGDDRQPFSEGSGRLELARKIADPENPLTARVMVNRIWMHHFGRPIVGTPSDFGTRSDPPTHPELLDFLARRFVEGGWSVKAMHRLIVNSNAYRQSSVDRPEAARVDPENLLLWRQNRRRLELEPMRDAMLAAAGRLDPSFGGRPTPSPSDPGGTRRTLYSMIDRTFLDGVYRTFDFGSTEVSNPSRPTTIVPQQALFLMNSPFVAEQARHLARRSAEEPGSTDPEARIQWLYRHLLGRPPEPGEVEVGVRFLSTQADRTEAPVSPWTYGFGAFDEGSARVVAFRPLAHWTGEAYQFGPEYPHPEGHYLRLQEAGGHAGSSREQAAIRRWVAQSDAVVRIEGRLAHRSAEGDGVRARVVAGDGGLLGEWTAHDGRERTIVDRYEVKAGEAIDFVVDCIGGAGFDSFEWAPEVQAEAPDGSVARFDARADFGGPPSPPPSPEEQYAQALLMTNEFLYVD